MSDNPDFNVLDNRDTFNIRQTFGRFSYSHINSNPNNYSYLIESISPFQYAVEKTAGDVFVVSYNLYSDETFKIYGLRVYFPSCSNNTINNGLGVRFKPVLFYYDETAGADGTGDYIEIEGLSNESALLSSSDLDSYKFFSFSSAAIGNHDFKEGEYLIGLRIIDYNNSKVAFGVDMSNRQGRRHFLHKSVGQDWSTGFLPKGSVMMDLYTKECQMIYDFPFVCGDVWPESCYTMVDAVKENNISIYPNPTTGLIQLEDVNDSRIEIYTIIGLKVKTFYSKKISKTIDLSDLPNGIYIVSISNSQFKITKELILSK